MDKNIKEIERRKLNKKVLKKTSCVKQINNIFIIHFELIFFEKIVKRFV